MLVVVHSPKGGVGSTAMCAHIAMQLSVLGHQVTAVDGTWQDTLKLYFGLLPDQELVEMTNPLGDAMVVSGVDIMNGFALLHSPAFLKQLENGHADVFDGNRITVLDIASDDRALKQALMPYVDLHLCTLMPRADSLAMLPMVEPGTPTVSLPKTAFILNQLDDRKRLSRHTSSFITTLLGDELIGSVRYDEAVNEAVAMFEPLTKFAPLSVFLPDMQKLAIAIEARLGLVPQGEATHAIQKLAE